ncbi:MAG: tRNA glutamyl-Q(34) synthetase GluQRS [Pseudomonadota bacterium]
MTSTFSYRGRFAPSPTGPLHAGSLVAALASWLDARAHGGLWLVRIEDVDIPRTVAGATEYILQQLSDCGLVSDEPIVLQSTRPALYQEALDRLLARGLAYPCCCSRKDIAAAILAHGGRRERHAELVYPGTCRNGLPPLHHADHSPCAWRVVTEVLMKNGPLALVKYDKHAINSIAINFTYWHDRRLGAQQQDVAHAVGDFVLKRADGCFTYQLAVVVDDRAQGITHIVRGEDLADNTARQILLQHVLELPTPQYLHTPLVLGANGEKLSKQNGAQALDTSSPEAALAALQQAARVLGLPPTDQGDIQQALAQWIPAWAARYLATAARMDRAT